MLTQVIITIICSFGKRIVLPFFYQPIPFLISPMGPMGLMQGTLIYVGVRVMSFLEHLQGSYGISPIVVGMVVCLLGGFGGMILLVLLTVLSTPTKEKNE